MVARKKEGAAKVPLPGSERLPLAGAKPSGKLNPRETIQVTLILKPRSSREKLAAVEKIASQRPHSRAYLTREQLASSFGPTPESIARIEEFARDNALAIVDENAAARSVVLSGTIAQFGRAFGVKLARCRHPTGIYRVRSGPIYLPANLAPVVQAVLGLDDRPQARSHVRLLGKRAAAAAISYTPPQVARLYDFPTGLDGTGQSVAIIELGGGFTTQDLQAYFSSLGISPTPSVLAISVDGATNSPTGDPSGPDAEVMLDIEMIGSIAPKASIYVYFAPNTDAGFVDAVSAAVNDAQHKPSIISISWGEAESAWTSQGISALEQAFQDAALVGVTVAAASGDSGSSDGVTDGLAHVDFPASSPYVLGCGGTEITTSSDKETITGEVVWNDQPSGGATGGGISDLFPLPAWQSNADVPPSANPGGHVGRGVPDVAGDADPNSGYTIQADGSEFAVGGTSAVAPLWTALLTMANQDAATGGREPVGFINPTLYQSVPATSGALIEITSGSNGAYSAGPGWSACTGLGRPDGAKLLGQLEP